ncbi:hypothetical protein [Croceimicrobium sp.]|uniref:hypothetical protein n=1 Tax=Croceimicrobium sp. TaxID=2828340 RepID=UPI003BAAF89C
MIRLLSVIGIIVLMGLLHFLTFAFGIVLEEKTLAVLTFLLSNFLLILVIEKRELYICLIASLVMGLFIFKAFFFGLVTYPLAYIIHLKSQQEYNRPAQFHYFPTKPFESLISEKEIRKFTSWDFAIMGLALAQGLVLVFSIHSGI